LDVTYSLADDFEIISRNEAIEGGEALKATILEEEAAIEA
jgi:hypothetical protein